MVRMIFAAVVVLVLWSSVCSRLRPRGFLVWGIKGPTCIGTAYQSLEQCYPTVLAGNRGFCNPNPYFIAPYRSTEHRHYRQRHTRPQ